MDGFTLGEVFELVEKAESNAAAFYRKVAKLQVNLHESEKLNGLARMEEEHRAFFAEMERKAAGTGKVAVQDPYGEVRLYLNGLIERHGGEGSVEMAHQLKGSESLEEVLGIAIEAEAQSILFYVGLKDSFVQEDDRKTIETIINEEKNHVVILRRMLEAHRKTL
jgi:rubrerythrin